jgi:glycosyltransferase involved in cell wall biosynthesis
VSQYPKYSIVIPAFNETARIPATLESVIACIRENAWDAEVIVVNDGSTDSTAQLVLDMAREAPEIRLLENPGNRGKGYAVRNGVLHALGDIVMFTDSDLSAPMNEAERLFAAIAGGADIAIGSRWLASSRQTHRQPLYRQFFGRCFNAVCRMVRNAVSRRLPEPPRKLSSSSKPLSAGASTRKFSSSPSNAATRSRKFL